MNGITKYDDKRKVPDVRVEVREDCAGEVGQIRTSFHQQREEMKFPFPDEWVEIEIIPEPGAT